MDSTARGSTSDLISKIEEACLPLILASVFRSRQLRPSSVSGGAPSFSAGHIAKVRRLPNGAQ